MVIDKNHRYLPNQYSDLVEIFDNIRKLYRFEDPCEELADYIEFFSETSLDATHHYVGSREFTVRLFPSYTPTIWINLGSPYQIKNGNKWHLIDQHTDILLLRNDIVERKNLPTDNIFTVKFYPGGFEAVFDIEQRKIGSDIVNINTLIPSGIIRKAKRMDCFRDRLAFLQNYFLSLLNRKFADNHLYKKVVDAVNTYNLSGLSCNNRQVATEMAMTDKTLYRYFKNLIGTPPKQYFSIVRARTALTAYVADKNLFSPFDYGYYDMSHFYKEVVKFTGEKLSSYRT